MRVPVWDVAASFGGYTATIVNISRSGVLLALHRSGPTPGEQGQVVFELAQPVALAGTVVREHEERPRPRNRQPLWHVAIAFDLSDPAAVASAVQQVMAAQRHRRVA